MLQDKEIIEIEKEVVEEEIQTTFDTGFEEVSEEFDITEEELKEEK